MWVQGGPDSYLDNTSSAFCTSIPIPQQNSTNTKLQIEQVNPSPSTVSQLWNPSTSNSGIYYNIHAFQGPATGTVCWASPNGDEIVINQNKNKNLEPQETGTFKKGIELQLSPYPSLNSIDPSYKEKKTYSGIPFKVTNVLSNGCGSNQDCQRQCGSLPQPGPPPPQPPPPWPGPPGPPPTHHHHPQNQDKNNRINHQSD